jgi:hypothetical protein
MTRRLLLVLAVAALLAGCGGGDSTSRSDYIRAADDVCTRANDESNALNRRFAELTRGVTDQREIMRKAAPILTAGHDFQRDYVAEFKALDAPEGDGETIDAIHAALEEQVAALGRLADAAGSGEAARFRTAQRQVTAARTEARRRLKAYGFEVCGA